MKIRILTILACLLCSACSNPRYNETRIVPYFDGNGKVFYGTNTVSFSRRSLGSKLGLGELDFAASTNGSKSIHIKGLQSDGVQAIGVVTESAVKAAIESMKPTPAPVQ